MGLENKLGAFLGKRPTYFAYIHTYVRTAVGALEPTKKNYHVRGRSYLRGGLIALCCVSLFGRISHGWIKRKN